MQAVLLFIFSYSSCFWSFVLCGEKFLVLGLCGLGVCFSCIRFSLVYRFTRNSWYPCFLFHLYNSLPLLIVGCMRVYVCVCLKVRMYVFMHMSARYMHTYEQIYIHFTHSAGEDDDDTNAIIGSFNNISSSTTQTPSTIAT